MNKADALRQKRKQAIALLDSLTQSIFLEMFGDPIQNHKSWPTASLSEFEEFLTSGSRGWAKYYSRDGSLFIRIQNLVNGQLSLGDSIRVKAPDNAEAKRTLIQEGDVLISITADLGRIAVVPKEVGPAHINQHIALFRSRNIMPAYLAAYLASSGGKIQFASLNRQGVKAGLNFNDIRSLKILVPPKELQDKFVQRTAKLRSIEPYLSRSSVDIDTLFSSIQHRAFSREL